MPIEIEIKLAFNDSVSASMLEVLVSVLKSLNCNHHCAKKELKNAYFDTPNFSLNQHKVALRIRKSTDSEGEVVYIQTFKTAGQSVNGLSQRGEWEWELAENELDIALLQQCEAWPANVDTKNLVTLFETNFTRYIFEVNWENSLIELVLDWGKILSNDQSEKIHEVELELKQGNQDDLKAFADRLINALPLCVSDISKAQRGIKLFQASK